MRLVDVRHEQTAVFAAEATAKLTRTPGLAVVTAGPGVTNVVSGVTTAHFNGSPLRRARRPLARQPLGHRRAAGARPAAAARPGDQARRDRARHRRGRRRRVRRVHRSAARPHRGPVFLDVADGRPVLLRRRAGAGAPAGRAAPRADPDDVDEVVRLLARGAAPGARARRRRLGRPRRGRRRCASSRPLGIPVIANGMGRGVVPAGHPLLVTRARGTAFGERRPRRRGRARRWTSGSATASSAARTAPTPAKVVHVVDSPEPGLAAREPRRRTSAATSPSCSTRLREGVERAAAAPGVRRLGRAGCARGRRRGRREGRRRPRAATATRSTPRGSTASCSRASPTTPSSSATAATSCPTPASTSSPRGPAAGSTPGPYGCLGTGLGYADRRAARPARRARSCCCSATARPASRSWTSTRSCATTCRSSWSWATTASGAWRSTRCSSCTATTSPPSCGPARATTRSSRALGGGGETVTDPAQIGPALDRAFDSRHPLPRQRPHRPRDRLPRSTTGI